MLLKAGFIVAIFMHMAWERLALKLAILVPPLALLVLIGLMAIEGDYTFLTRLRRSCSRRRNRAAPRRRSAPSIAAELNNCRPRSCGSARSWSPAYSPS